MGNAKSVPEWICQSFGTRYTVQGIVGLLKRIGFAYKKAAGVPCEAGVPRQEEFMQERQSLLKGEGGTGIVAFAVGLSEPPPPSTNFSKYLFCLFNNNAYFCRDLTRKKA